MQSTRVLDVLVSAVDLLSAAETIIGWKRSGHRGYVAVTGVHGIMEAQDDTDFKQILNDADLCVPDGVPLVWLSRLAGHKETGRVFGPDLMLQVSGMLAATGGSAFYYGGAPGVAEELADEMAARFPGIKCAGIICPPFRDLTDQEAEEYVAQMNQSNADILWIGLSTPKQERWMAKFRPRLTIPAIVGVGAAFDYNTGRLTRAPKWVQRCALEWLYRLIQEPRRLWRRYMRNNPLFIWYLLRDYCGLWRPGSPETKKQPSI